MVTSVDVDLYPKNDPDRADEVAKKLGFGSAFETAHGIYADAVSPTLAALPEGWELRLVSVKFGKATGWFLDPNNAAVSKYVRGEARDRTWLRAGLIPFLYQKCHYLHRTKYDASSFQRRLEGAGLGPSSPTSYYLALLNLD